MGIGPMARWNKASLPDLWTRFKWALAVAAVAAVILPLILGRWSPLIAAGLFLALWVVVSSIVSLRTRLAGSHRQGLIAKLAANAPSYYGMLLAHLGVAVFITGVTLVKGYESEQDVRLDLGQSVDAGGHAFQVLGVVSGPRADYR